MLEKSTAAARGLRENVAALAAEQVSVHRADAMDWLASSPVTPFDLCFVDPPFSSGLLAPTLSQLVTRGWVQVGGMVYVEFARGEPLPPLPESLEWFRDKVSGQVRYGLLQVVSR
jgi:16S rRNA (guanine966-N2)-methyltransferase